jgi:hypothetical protein
MTEYFAILNRNDRVKLDYYRTLTRKNQVLQEKNTPKSAFSLQGREEGNFAWGLPCKCSQNQVK